MMVVSRTFLLPDRQIPIIPTTSSMTRIIKVGDSYLSNDRDVLLLWFSSAFLDLTHYALNNIPFSSAGGRTGNGENGMLLRA